MNARNFISFNVLRHRCGHLPVVLGAGRAADLYRLSFADILDEDTGRGYQRPFDPAHAREFRRYIDQPGSTTIPLTFNLRGENGDGWFLDVAADGEVGELRIEDVTRRKPVLSRVDCQHRLGKMHDSDVVLTFQCFLGLSPRQEMAVFNTINSKAKGLNPSLLDFHTTELVKDYETLRMDLFIAKQLHTDPRSVWHKKVKLGGRSTQGTKRPISLRGLSFATKLLLDHAPSLASQALPPEERYQIVRAFWQAVAATWPTEWDSPRRHLLMKGVGVSGLSLLAGDIIQEHLRVGMVLTSDSFEARLFALRSLDWSSTGPFNGYGGRKGATRLYAALTAAAKQTAVEKIGAS